ncbi:leucine-rich repeat domain-containing protein [Thermincola ferriacetica]
MDNDAKMTYGHPGADTSYTTIKIDDAEIIYSPNIVAPTNNMANLSNISQQNINNIAVRQDISIVKNSFSQKDDTVQIKYTVINNDSTEHQVGLRIMLDTMLGDNDYAPFKVPQIGDVTKELELSGQALPEYWQVFDNLETPAVAAQGTISNAGYKPSKIQFASWPYIDDIPWNYVVTPDKNIGDSAVAIYWDPVTLAPGESIDFITYYGLGSFQANANLGLTLGVTGATSLTLNNGIYNPNPFAITAYITNTNSTTANNVKLTLNLQEELRITNGQPNTVVLGTVDSGKTVQHSWQVETIPLLDSKTLSYTVKLEAEGQEPREVTRQISIPGTRVTFTDPNLERCVREAIGKEEGEILRNDVLELTELTATCADIESLEGIEFLENLTYLNLSYNNISDITPLQSLSKLENLKLKFNPIESIQPLSGLTSLQRLDLAYTGVSDISPLLSLLSLEALDLKGNGISDIRSLVNVLKFLWYLDLSNNSISNRIISNQFNFMELGDDQLELFQEATNLRYLNLSNNNLQDVSNLQSAVNLTHLSLAGNNLNSIDSLASLTNLISLVVSENQIGDVSAVGSMPNLMDLDVSNNQISDYQPVAEYLNRLASMPVYPVLGNVTDVVYFEDIIGTGFTADMLANQVVSISDPNLERVIRSKIGFSTSTLFKRDLEGITDLDASAAGITNLDGIENLVNLKRLDLSNNNISDIEPLKDLANLTSLNLSNNNITAIDDLSNLTNLNELNLSDNEIVSLSPLA